MNILNIEKTRRLLKSSRRFYKDRHHAYGWEIGFRQTVELMDGTLSREMFFDIGVDRRSAIANALRCIPLSAR